MAALSSSTFTNLGGAAADILGGIAQSKSFETNAAGARLEAENYGMAAELADKNAAYTRESTAIQVMQQTRTNFQQYGGARADIAGAGLRESGSGLYILQDNARQGSLALTTLQKQGAITEEGYVEQSKAYKNLQKASLIQAQADEEASDDSFLGGLIGGGFKLAAAAAPFLL